ncbi:MAG TPA: preprotein translocase subunit SecA, partial [Spirochaetota bacterium]|nr:preprotein translocase subunit SecA [Spirochaetota bacterium]
GQDQHKALEVIRKAREWLDNHNTVVAAGGLHILGTERHEARRIDNQLRGRSGRQGDPGSSRFYLSLEDDLMRIFGSERIAGVMQRLGMEEGQEIESRMVSRAIENAQKRVESRNFEIRKHLLEYDDVMNSQREYVYKERNAILDGEDVSIKIKQYIGDVVESWVPYFTQGKRNAEDWDIEGLNGWLYSKFGFDLKSIAKDDARLSHDEIIDGITNKLMQLYSAKEVEIGSEHMRTLERLVSLQVIDAKWRDHLLVMDDLRDGIWTAGYSERNPLVEYKLRGFELFNEMLDNLKLDIIEMLLKVRLQKVEEIAIQPEQIAIPMGKEYHPEVEQFGAGGIPVAPPPIAIASQGEDKTREVAGGVRRKKTRRSRRG